MGQKVTVEREIRLLLCCFFYWIEGSEIYAIFFGAQRNGAGWVVLLCRCLFTRMIIIYDYIIHNPSVSSISNIKMNLIFI